MDLCFRVRMKTRIELLLSVSLFILQSEFYGDTHRTNKRLNLAGLLAVEGKRERERERSTNKIPRAIVDVYERETISTTKGILREHLPFGRFSLSLSLVFFLSLLISLPFVYVTLTHTIYRVILTRTWTKRVRGSNKRGRNAKCRDM